jgi:hypothetical protein
MSLARLFRRLPLQLLPRRCINQTEADPQSPRLSSHGLRLEKSMTVTVQVGTILIEDRSDSPDSWVAK